MPIAWKDTKPAWWNPGDYSASAVDTCPPFALPASRKYASSITFQDETPQEYFDRGVTHINKFSLDNPDTGLPPHQTYNDLLPDGLVLPQKENTTSQTIDNTVNALPLNAIFGVEIENDGAFSKTSPKCYEFFEKTYARFAAKKAIDGHDFYIMKPNYDAMDNVSVTDATKCNRYYNDPASTWGQWEINDAPNRWNCVIVSGYMHSHYASYMMYDIAAHSELITKAGLIPTLFTQPHFEWPGGVAYGPGFRHGIPSQGGIMYRADRPYTPFNYEIAKPFLTAFFSDKSLFIPWNGLHRMSRNPDKLSLISAESGVPGTDGKDTFVGPGSYVYNTNLNDRYNANFRRHNILPVGIQLLSTCNATDGGEGRNCRYRINGGSWWTPGTAMPVKAETDKKGLCRMRMKNGIKDLLYFSVYDPNTVRTIEVEDPFNGEIHTGSIFGSTLHIARLGQGVDIT